MQLNGATYQYEANGNIRIISIPDIPALCRSLFR